MTSSRVLRRLAVAFGFGLLLAFVPLPGMQFSIESVGATTDLPTTSPMTPEAVAQVQAASDEPLGGDRVVAEQPSAAEFTAIGLTFDSPPDAPVMVRVKDAAGQFGPWRELATEEDEGPDRNTAEGNRSGTEPLWVGTGTGYEVGLSASDAADADVVTVHDVETRTTVEATPMAGAALPQPFGINYRGSWGARAPTSTSYGSTVKLAVVHHSASSNDYSPADVPGVLRSIQAYHMDGRGWSDIAYNFVVDKYGSIWEGRAGGIDQSVIGAHAMGFNTNSVGVMVIGDYTAAAPTAAALESVSKVIGWKLALYNVDPTGRVEFVSGGSTSIPAGQLVNLPRVVGHQDVGQTGCPGSIEGSLPFIRARSQDWTNFVRAAAVPVGSVDALGVGNGVVQVGGWAADPDGSGPVTVRLSVGGVVVDTPANMPRPDVAAANPALGPTTGFVVRATGVPPGYQDMCVTALNQGFGADVNLLCRPVIVGDPAGRAPTGSLTSAVGFVGGVAVSGTVSAPAPGTVDLVGIEINGQVRQWATLSGAQFSARIVGVVGGTHTVCVQARLAGTATFTRISCQTATIGGSSAVGSVDTITAAGGAIQVGGWALDPETTNPIIIAVVVDGRPNSYFADGYRPDIDALYPGYGPNHGYTASIPAAPGAHTVCVQFGGTGLGPNVVAGCKSVVVK